MDLRETKNILISWSRNLSVPHGLGQAGNAFAFCFSAGLVLRAFVQSCLACCAGRVSFDNLETSVTILRAQPNSAWYASKLFLQLRVR